MTKRLTLFLIYLVPFIQFAQDFSALWEGHFSYLNINDITHSNTKIYAAADNAIFSYDTLTKELEKLTTVNGLSGETIATIHYSEAYELLIIGYENGLIEIAFDNDSNILSVVDILDKVTVPPSKKRINHINEYNELLYIATNYGISVYNLERLEFGDTYFIGNSGSQIPVKQTTVFQDYIYAACYDNNGVKKAFTTNPNLIDFQQWQTINTGNWSAMQTVDNSLYALNANNNIYNVNNDVFSLLASYSDIPLDIRSAENKLIITTENDVFIYNSDFSLIKEVPVNAEFITQYTSAILKSDEVFIGTKNYGIVKTFISNSGAYEIIHPDGPLLNKPFSLNALNNELWVTFGEYDIFFNPYPLNQRGISHLKDNSWINTPFADVFDAVSLNSIAINPFNKDQVFISSFFSGLLEINDDIPEILYNETNSGLESLVLPGNPNYIDIRVGPIKFNSEGNLWTLTSKIDEPLKLYNPNSNSWKSFSFTDIIPDGFSGELGFRDLELGTDNNLWIASYSNGVIGFKENGGNTTLKRLNEESQGLPDHYVTTLALDKRNQLWIGTFRGLRVLYNTANFFTDDNVRAEEIIILEDGVAKELLFQQYITDIEVDGSNNKWIGTVDSGIFYFSSDGQKTIYHFTKDNSPLPSNVIQDIVLNVDNGTVFIATSRGLVSFQSGSSGTNETLEDAYVYPNPVRPTFNITEDKVKIQDISDNINIKITDIEGNLVAEAQSRTNLRYRGYNLEIDGGTAYWNGKNLANNVVASGVYLVMLSNLETFETRVLKLMVVR